MNRKPSIFEKILLLIGISILMIGYGFIHQQVKIQGMTVEILIAVFLWLILVAMIILIAVNENMKEELKQIIRLNSQEVRILHEDSKKK